MKRNAPNNPKAEGSAGDTRDSTLNLPRRVARLTPRHRRVLRALLVAPQSREAIDRISGASNGPDEILRLRRRFGLQVPCVRKGGFDRDGQPVEFGTYFLALPDYAKAWELLESEVRHG